MWRRAVVSPAYRPNPLGPVTKTAASRFRCASANAAPAELAAVAQRSALVCRRHDRNACRTAGEAWACLCGTTATRTKPSRTARRRAVSRVLAARGDAASRRTSMTIALTPSLRSSRAADASSQWWLPGRSWIAQRCVASGDAARYALADAAAKIAAIAANPHTNSQRRAARGPGWRRFACVGAAPSMACR